MRVLQATYQPGRAYSGRYTILGRLAEREGLSDQLSPIRPITSMKQREPADYGLH